MNEEMKKSIEEKEEFKGLCLEVLPLANKLQEILKSRGITELASITLSADGYMTFSHHDTEWEMNRVDKESSTRIRCQFSEEIELKEDGGVADV